MKIWQLKPELDKYDAVTPAVDFSAEEIQNFDGRRQENWKPLQITRMFPEEKLPLCDYPRFTIPVFSRNALDTLESLVKKDIQILELGFEEKEYFGINVTNVIDAIDYEKSEYKRFSSSNRIMYFKKYSFVETDELKRSNIFKIKDEPRRYPFVSDLFKQMVEKNKLTGFDFELVWDSDEEAVISCE